MAMASLHSHLLHVVAIPYPAQGHINPMLQLCQQLVPRGFTFTFINTDHIHHRLHRAGHLCPSGRHHDPCCNENGSCHVLVDHPLCEQKDTACQHHDAHVQDEDAHMLHNGHGVRHGHAADHGDDARVHVHDASDGDGVRDRSDNANVHTHDAYDGYVSALEMHYYKGCSSIRMVSVQGGCAPEQHGHLSTSMDAFKAAQEMGEPVEHFLSHIMEEQTVDFIMSDILLGWSSATAHKFGLPWVGFWAASSASLSAFIYFSNLANQGESCIPVPELDDEEAPPFEGIPGLPPTSRCDVPKVWDAQGKVYELIGSYFKAVEQAVMVLLNTCVELEGQVLEALSKRFPIQAVGPLLPSRYFLHTCLDNKEEEALGRRPSLFTEDLTCLSWLDKQAPSSVLFISFGSISLRSNEQLQELAKGVEASGCPFLLVCKPDISHEQEHSFSTHKDGLPHGLIVPWAPQLQVLSHPSVGGFVTHCGWNSVIESASMGVPMLCWADTGERMSNQRFVVEFWKCGIDMVADRRRAKQHIDEAVLVNRDDIEKSIRFLMLEEGGASIRVHSAKLREAAIKCYQDSQAQLNQFAQIMIQRYYFVLWVEVEDLNENL